MLESIELGAATKFLKRDLIKRTQRERDWWFTKELNQKELVSFPEVGEGFRLIFLLREGKEPKLALPSVLDVTTKISKKWREKISDFVLNPEDWYLSVTSLYRDQQLQNKLGKKTPNALTKSTHHYGAAVDFDPNGFYLKQNKGFIPINQATNPNLFDEKLTSLLYETISGFNPEMINFVPEVSSVNEDIKKWSCFHVCVSPEYELQNNSS